MKRALSAEHLFERDRHYLVRDEAVQIIDLPTGRRAPDRSFEGGIQSLIEAKEGVALTPHRETVARISYQRFFRRYLRLAGMTGTAREVARELWNIYGLRTVTVPTRLPSQRLGLGVRVLSHRRRQVEGRGGASSRSPRRRPARPGGHLQRRGLGAPEPAPRGGRARPPGAERTPGSRGGASGGARRERPGASR